MSRNATAIKHSVSSRPVDRLRSVTPSTGIEQEHHQLTTRVQRLKNLAMILLKEAQALEGDALTSELTTPQEVPRIDIENGIKLGDAVRQFESNIIQQALLITGGNQAKAARMLGIKANTLNYKIKLYNF